MKILILSKGRDIKANNAVKKVLFAHKAPRFGLYYFRNRLWLKTYFFCELRYRSIDIPFPIAFVASET